jgi:Fur family peroxide stress response transcriptional regulator
MASKRNSAQKRIIGETLKCMDHPTATEVYERVRMAYPQISLGTVYRNLGSMAEEGAVLRLSFTGEPDRFDPQTHEHCHVVCRCCGRIVDTDSGLVSELVQNLDRVVGEDTGMLVEGHSLFFSGVCVECRGHGHGQEDRDQRDSPCGRMAAGTVPLAVAASVAVPVPVPAKTE